MTKPKPPSPVAMWSSITARAKAASRTSSKTPGELQREYVYGRLLARVFADQDDSWVLKGGTALLMRVEDARHSKDVDLLHRVRDLSAAEVDLRRVLAQDLGDWMRFVVTGTFPLGGDQQPDVSGMQVNVECFCGAQKIQAFHIDLVVGSLMTADPDVAAAPSVIAVPQIDPPRLRLYPVVDHVADKVCATEAVYPGGRESSRVRDLVDLLVIARTQQIDGSALDAAIAGERTHRGLPGRDAFTVPAAWSTTYAKVAANTPSPSGFDEAVVLAGDFLDPVLQGAVSGLSWSPETGRWA
ncbi:nucleotidyl transferase AbiEii/AbiGii toxin family protein [Isoptericola sp. G70]|uniref:nucleotidyl transferase AbiEii/AbiGii toxin family protein n=1 Tax=Isoptericola sp. G70 TaxID=3376633 RepID=UPI003A80E89A